MTSKLLQFVFGIYIICFGVSATVTAQLQPFADFGDNPGELTASIWLPETPKNNLVIVLHGCGQQADWLVNQTAVSHAADSHGFILLLPQQSKANNLQLCFNWFSTDDHLKDSGETATIMNMMTAVEAKYNIENTYIIGLSAGASLATSLVAQYPNRFNAAAIIAGIGFPCADTLVKALSCMKNGFTYPIDVMVESVNKLTPKTQQWPNLTVITGADDKIVNPINSEQITAQWQGLIGADKTTTDSDLGQGITFQRHVNSTTKDYVELLIIAGIDHGWPINAKVSAKSSPAPFVLESPLSTIDYLIDNWNL